MSADQELKGLRAYWRLEAPFPTEEQWEEAKRRYRLECDAHNQELAKLGKVDGSDYQSGRLFVIAAYMPAVWRHYSVRIRPQKISR